MNAWRTGLLALSVPLLVAAEAGPQDAGSTLRSREAGAPASAASALSPEDLELLSELPLLLEWDLLREWDPDEDLPIPLETSPGGGEGSR